MNNRILSDFQFGFLPGRSTQLAIFELSIQIYSAINNKKIYAICLDISKAFDCINHMKLLNKLKSCGIAEDVLCLFKSYFNRSQEVKIGNYTSKCKSVSTGIGQGTILGPLIFVLYINDVIHNVAELRVNIYADDCLILRLEIIGKIWLLKFRLD